ncbi:MAG: DUF4097 domain-containing protein [Treponemataceae bacterium]|nr:DUF4097 domain-containing protein [Treponemataceae bacterium]
MKHIPAVVLSLLLALISVSCVSNQTGRSGYEEKSWLFSVSDADSIDINMYKTAVEVNLWNNNEIFVISESNNGNFPDCYISGSTLLCKIDGKEECSRGTVKVYVPESFFAEQWKISTVSGSVKASLLWGKDCEINTTSGSITLEKCELKEAAVSSTSGKIVADKLVCSSNADFSSTSGSVRIRGALSKLDVNTTSGAIEIDMDEPFYGNCSVSSLSGAIRIGMPDNSGFRFEYNSLTGLVTDDFTAFKGKGSGNVTYKNGGISIVAETLTGAISLEKKTKRIN